MKVNQTITPFTSFRIGGTVEYLSCPRTLEALLSQLKFADSEGKKVRILGGGSNLLVDDRSVIPGLCIRMHQFQKNRLKVSGNTLLCGTGARLSTAIKGSIAAGLCGLEKFAGIPGTIGGAVVCNSGSGNRGIGELVAYVEGVTLDGKRVLLDRRELNFDYRSSNLNNVIVTQVCLRLSKAKGYSKPMADFAEFLRAKARSQPLSSYSAGCFFKNPPNAIAWKLIKAAGLQGTNVGDAALSAVHANFLLNLGRAKYIDVLNLVRQTVSTIEKGHSITLEPEVVFWGNQGD